MLTIEHIGVITGFVLLAPTTLYQIALWQRKQYRYDRMRARIMGPEGSLIRERALLIGIGLVGLAWVAYFLNFSTLGSYSSVAAVAAFAYHHALRIQRIGVSRPNWTIKALTLLAITVIAIWAYLRFVFDSYDMPTVQIATVLLLLPGVIALLVPVLNFIFYARKRFIVKQAANYRRRFPHLQVVGITGSFGKTSTKHFLSHIVAGSNRSFAATQRHCNLYFCVAQNILRVVTEKTQIYIAEMGAYRRGEIKQITDIVQPTIGVLTVIGNQHIDLFGSQDAILKTKWELAESLPKDGTLILNADDPRLVERSQTYTGKKLFFSIQKPADIWFDKVKVGPRDVKATLNINKQGYVVAIPLASAALLSSVAAAISAAVALGLSNEEIVGQLKTVAAFPRTMEVLTGMQGATIIDDSYSAGELGVRNAIMHLDTFTQTDKRIVMVPMIELGSEAPRAHAGIGALLARSGAKVYIFGEAYRQEIASQAGDAHIEWFNDPNAFTQAVTADVTKDTVMLLEGRIPGIAHKALLAS